MYDMLSVLQGVHALRPSAVACVYILRSCITYRSATMLSFALIVKLVRSRMTGGQNRLNANMQSRLDMMLSCSQKSSIAFTATAS